MEQLNSPSLLGIVGRINHAASDIRKRTSSIASVLGGGTDSERGEGSNKVPSDDMHSQLQTILTKLEDINDNLSRTERTVGVCPDNPGTQMEPAPVPYDISASIPGGQCGGSPLRRY